MQRQSAGTGLPPCSPWTDGDCLFAAPKTRKPAEGGLFCVLQICYSKGREACRISLALTTPTNHLWIQFAIDAH
jgi:hypothetical protein